MGRGSGVRDNKQQTSPKLERLEEWTSNTTVTVILALMKSPRVLVASFETLGGGDKNVTFEVLRLVAFAFCGDPAPCVEL